MKLNFGCGKNSMLEHINIDIVPYPNVDLVWNICNITSNFPYKEVDEIYAKDVIEHFHWADVPGILKGWAGLLKKYGKITLEFPDARRHCEALINGEWDLKRFNYQFFSQREPGQKVGEDWNLHKAAFDKNLITELLMGVGIVVTDVTPFKTPSTYNLKVVGIKR